MPNLNSHFPRPLWWRPSLLVMAACNHCAWVQLCGYECNCSFVDTYRFQSLVNSLPDPHNQTPSTLFFLGQKTKDEALRHIFPHNNLKKAKLDGLARIRIDNSSASSQHPILFGDADLSISIIDRHRPATCHSERAFPVQWQSSDLRSIADHVLTKVLFASCNLVIVFAADYRDFEHLADNLARWINIGVASDAPIQTRPRLLIVINGQSPERQQDVRELYRDLETRTRRRLNNLFSLVSSMYLEDGELSTLAVYRPLREEIFRQADEIRSTLVDKRWLFSGTHLAALFELRLQHAASNISENLSLIRGCRKYHTIPQDFPDHLSKPIRFGVEVIIRYETTASYVASSILMDAYPQGAHRKTSSKYLSKRLLTVLQSLTQTQCLKHFTFGPV